MPLFDEFIAPSLGQTSHLEWALTGGKNTWWANVRMSMRAFHTAGSLKKILERKLVTNTWASTWTNTWTKYFSKYQDVDESFSHCWLFETVGPEGVHGMIEEPERRKDNDDIMRNQETPSRLWFLSRWYYDNDDNDERDLETPPRLWFSSG